ncbi:hypothetical protein CRUP_031447 [Coryphaenoides rupestris]|nr:hypothetical protein CRUP_031447 [Coryphaenoides rupestris]
MEKEISSRKGQNTTAPRGPIRQSRGGHPPSLTAEANRSEEDQTQLLLERLKSLEEKNSTLALENTSQRETYERCLDEVANQVVQALLTQKKLHSRIMGLSTTDLLTAVRIGGWRCGPGGRRCRTGAGGAGPGAGGAVQAWGPGGAGPTVCF